MILLELFLVYFQIGLFAFGGGYAAMPLILSLVVEGKGWLNMAEYADLTTIAEMTPGPIAVNSATFVGQKMAGLPGAIVCTIGCILPSLIIVLVLAYFYTKFRGLKIVQSVLGELRPAVVAMIASAGTTILLLALFGTSSITEISSVHWIELGLFAVSLFALRKYKVNPIAVIFSTALAGTLLYLI
ncbi:MAG: chromate transporter [Solobacterium sp.]|nr:chromate transporter [Solobacterium sp.]